MSPIFCTNGTTRTNPISGLASLLVSSFSLGLLCPLLTCGVPAIAQVFVFEGESHWKTFQHDQLSQEMQLCFRVCTSYSNDASWVIELSYPDRYLERCVSRTDGSNIVTVAYYKPQYTNSINGYAFVEKADIPRGDGWLPLSAVWLAFDAPPYLDNLGTNRISPPYFKDGQADRMGFNSSVEFSVSRRAAYPRFAESMVFYHDGKAVNEKREWAYAPKPFDIGFTNAVFNVSRFGEDQFLSGGVPIEFSLDYFYPFDDARRGNSYRLYLTGSCRLWVTNIFVTNSMAGLFREIPPRVQYVDRRFMNSDTPDMRINYRSDRYLNDIEVRGLPEFAAARRVQARLSVTNPVGVARTPVPRWPVMVALATSLFLGPLVLRRAFLSKNKKETNK